MTHGSPLLSGGAGRCAGWRHERRGRRAAGPGQDELLDARGARPDRRSRAPLRRRAGAPCCGARGAGGAFRRRRATVLPGGDARAARGRVERRGHAARLRRSPRRDHRAGRPKMVINALNSGASVFMCCPRGRALADLGQRRRRACGRARCHPAHARVHVARRARATRSATSWRRSSCARAAGTWRAPRARRRPAGLGEPLRPALFLRWNGLASVARGSGPYVYLAKLESRHEASSGTTSSSPHRRRSACPRGTIRATVLIETITRRSRWRRSCTRCASTPPGLNAGRWDYIFSAIKKFRDDPAFVLPDRAA